MKNGVVSNKTDLCSSCQYCSKVQGYGKELKVCQALSGKVAFPVEICSAYQPKGVHSLYELQEMAIYIEKKKDSAGFRFYKNSDGQQTEVR